MDCKSHIAHSRAPFSAILSGGRSIRRDQKTHPSGSMDILSYDGQIADFSSHKVVHPSWHGPCCIEPRGKGFNNHLGAFMNRQGFHDQWIVHREQASLKLKLYTMIVVFIFFWTAFPATAQEAGNPDSETRKEEKPLEQGLEETMVVSASKVETPLIDAPVTMTVVKEESLQQSTYQNFGDILRTIPGVNVSQASAQDINFTTRQATGVLSNQQLGLVDGRRINTDWFGFIPWSNLSISFEDIKQVEVVRGPASAIWGSNAKNGVVNIVTKSPREDPGTAVNIFGGLFSRKANDSTDAGAGGFGGANFTHSQILNEMWSYRLSGGYFNSDAFARPTGRIPLSKIPGTDITTGGAFYPPYHNYGTSQPKFDFRLDQDLSANSKFTYTAGVGVTSGTTFYPAGVDEIERGVLGYGKANYANGNFKLQFFTNIVDGTLLNLFAPLPGGGYAEERFDSRIYDIETGHAIPRGNHQLFNFGG